jgi:hypothetical protein
LIHGLNEGGQLPTDVAEDMVEVNHMLRSKTFGAAWGAKTSNVEAWVQDLVQKAFDLSQDSLPLNYLSAAETALNTAINPRSLAMILDVRAESETYRQWVLDLLLAANSTTPLEVLQDLWTSSFGVYERRQIARYVGRHTTFPRESIEVDAINDKHLKYVIERASRLGSATVQLAG